MICKSSISAVTFGTVVKYPPENHLDIGSNLLWHGFFFYKSHRNAHEVRVFNLRILVPRLHIIAHVHERSNMYNKSILYIYISN